MRAVEWEGGEEEIWEAGGYQEVREKGQRGVLVERRRAGERSPSSNC